MERKNILLCLGFLMPILCIKDSFQNTKSKKYMDQLLFEHVKYEDKYYLDEKLYRTEDVERDSLTVDVYTKKFLIGIPR